MRRIIVHAGMHKTGTSVIQNTYAASRLSELAYFPYYGPNHTGLFVTLFEDEDELPRFHGFALSGRTKEEMLEERALWYKRTIDFIGRNSQKYFLFSSEQISTASRSSLERFRDFCFLHFDEISVIVYVRPPLSYMTSAFQELVKGSGLDRFDYDSFWPSYRARIEPIEDVFGLDRVKLRLYDKRQLIDGDVVADFSTVTGLRQPEASSSEDNRSLSLEAIAALYVQRHYGDGFVHGFSDAFAANERFVKDLQKLGSTRFQFSNSILSRAMATRLEDVSWINSRLGNELIDYHCHEPEWVIDSEHDLVVAAIRIQDRILELAGFDRVPTTASPKQLAFALDVIRRRHYESTEIPPEAGDDFMKLTEEEKRSARMSLAYSIYWAEERKATGNKPVDQQKWSAEIAQRMLDADQVLHQLERQGYQLVKSSDK